MSYRLSLAAESSSHLRRIDLKGTCASAAGCTADVRPPTLLICDKFRFGGKALRTREVLLFLCCRFRLDKLMICVKRASGESRDRCVCMHMHASTDKAYGSLFSVIERAGLGFY